MDVFPDAPGNTLADAAVIVYNEDGSINRESFGRVLSQLEMALCDALDKAHEEADGYAEALAQEHGHP